MSATDGGAIGNAGSQADAGTPSSDAGIAESPPPSTDAGTGSTAASCPPLSPPPGLCDDTWCWDYPAPFGYDLTAVAPGAGDDLWVAGDSIIARRSAGTWAMWPAPDRISKLWVSPSGAVFGLAPYGGGLHRFEGGKWTVELPGARDVSFVDATTAFALRDATIIRWDGTQWTQAFTPAATMQSIVARSASDVWATSGTVFVHFDGMTWTEAPHGFTTEVATALGIWATRPVDLSQVFDSPGGDLWAAGTCGGIAVLGGSGWELVQPPGCGWHSQGYAQVVGVIGTRNDSWFALRDVTFYPQAIGSYAYRFHHETANDAVTVDVDRQIAAIASTPSGLVAVGSLGTVWNQAGQSWTRAMGAPGIVSALAIDECGRGLAAAYVPPSMYTQSSRFLRNDGAGWYVDAEGVGVIGTLAAPRVDDAWATSNFYFNPLLHRDATGWNAVADLATDPYVNVVSASAADDVWALGRDLWHFDGRVWAGPFVLGQLHFVWTRTPTDAWALKMGERTDVSGLWHWDGSAWAAVAGPVTYAYALAGDSRGPWLAGVDSNPPDPRHSPTLFHLADGTWTELPLPAWAAGRVGTLQVTMDGNVYIGVSGMPSRTMVRWDGASFTTTTGGRIAADAAGHIWLGTSGGILRHR
jgi:hypothetical protein